MKKIYLLIITFILVAGIIYTDSAVLATKPIIKPKTKVAKKIALTFDADMTSSMLIKLDTGKEKSLYNKEIINILEREKVPATIFITGLWAEKYPEAVKEIASSSLFEIGNHSYSHQGFTSQCYNLGALKEKDKTAEITKAQDVLEKFSGKKPNLFRFPGGCANKSDEKIVNSLGLKVIGWTLASGDAFNSNTKAIIDNVLHNAKDGSIIVFHLSGGRYAPKTADVIKTIIPKLKKQGYEFVTVSDLEK